MENIELTIGKRYLFQSKSAFTDEIVEGKILEISPSKDYINIRWKNGYEMWMKRVKFEQEYRFIEQLDLIGILRKKPNLCLLLI